MTALVLQQNRLCWYGHVLRKEDDYWVKKCMEYEVEGSRPRGRPKRTWREVVKEDCQAHKMKRGCRGPLQMEKGDKGCPMIRTGVSGCFFWYRPTRVVPDQRPLNSCVCVLHSPKTYTIGTVSIS